MKKILITLSVFFSPALLADEVGENEIILGCIKEAPPVVYVNPSSVVKKKVVSYLEAEAVTGKLSCKSEHNASWYCGKKQFRLYQGLNSMGKKMEQGLVCNSEYESPLEKFYKEELILESTCFRVFWSGNSFTAFYGNL